MKKNTDRVAAAIDIGSSAVRMHIAQWNGKTISLLDQLEQPVHLGQEVFTTGYISFREVRALSSVLSGFVAVAREYGVGRIRAVATTALREASNRAHVLDHIHIQNHLDVEVLENGDSNSLLFDAMLREHNPRADKALMVYAGTGSIGMALRRGGTVAYTQSLHTGLLKIAEMLRSTAEMTRHIDQVAEEYLHTSLMRADQLMNLSDVEAVSISSWDVDLLVELCGTRRTRNTSVLERKALEGFYEEHRLLTPNQIAARYNLSPEQGGVLYAAMALAAALLGMTAAEEIFCSQINLTDALLNLQLLPGARRAYDEGLREGALASVREMAARYGCTLSHSSHMEEMAAVLFERLRKVHGLSRRQSLFLRAACILHEIGGHTNAEDSQEASFDLVKDAQIYGMSYRDTLLTANIIAPQSILGVEGHMQRGKLLENEDMLFVTKMHALLHLCDALDYSRKQKGRIVRVELEEENRLKIAMQVRGDFTMESWMAEQSATLFEEVFGLEPYLEIEYVHSMEE